MSRRQKRLAIPAICLVLLGACSAPAPSVTTQIQNRLAAADRATPYTSLAGVLPNHKYRMGSGPEFSYSTAVIVGVVESVEPGRAFGGSDSPAGTQLDFDSSDALWRTFHATVKVDELVAGELEARQVVVGLALGPDAERESVESDLRGLGRVLLFLTDSPVFDYAKGAVWATAEDGALIATVDADGRIATPAAQDESRMVAGLTLDTLREAARQPVRQVTLDASGSTVLGESSR